ncbi:MAG: DUF1572 family protein [bacterium]|nr:DUF1572 family protein [bacterium]
MESYKKLYLGFLDQLKEEISMYRYEADIWKVENGISNAPGNLCLHICGNLNHFFGAVVGHSGYVRDRDLEFSAKDVSRAELMKKVDDTKEMIEKVFSSLKAERINEIYPIDKFGENVTIGFIMSRLVSHLSYHVGQINYHRRLTESISP